MPVTPTPIAEIAGRGGVIERREYLIDHFRVSFERGAEWNCICAEFRAVNSCRHTREAAGMREAQAQISAGVVRGGARLSGIGL
jgi:hypothetical protein